MPPVLIIDNTISQDLNSPSNLNQTTQIAEKLLSIYGIQAHVYTMTIEKQKLDDFYGLFIYEMRRFSSTFLSNLRVDAISICESMKPLDQKYAANLGLFVLDRLPDAKSIQQQWFKMILYHFLKSAPRFYEQWKDYINRDPNMSRNSSPFGELLVSFNHLMGTSQDPWQKDNNLKTRVNFLHLALKKFDFDLQGPSEDNDTSKLSGLIKHNSI